MYYPDKSAHIYFSIMEKASFHGPVMNPDSVSLDNGANLLKTSIENNKFLIALSVPNSSVCNWQNVYFLLISFIFKNMVLNADSSSFHEITRQPVKKQVTNNGVPGGTVAAIVIVLCIVGIIIGVIIGIYRARIIDMLPNRNARNQKKEDVIGFANKSVNISE